MFIQKRMEIENADTVLCAWVLALATLLCCVLGQDTQLSQFLSPPKCLNGTGEIMLRDPSWSTK